MNYDAVGHSIHVLAACANAACRKKQPSAVSNSRKDRHIISCRLFANLMCGTDDNALSALEWRLMNTSLIGHEAPLRAAASPDGEPQLKELAS
jgi:hypothetical protein